MSEPEYVVDISSSHTPDPEWVALKARLQSDPGTVHYLGCAQRSDGLLVFTAALDCIPDSTIELHVMSEYYPRIVGSLKAQGCRVKPDSILTLIPTSALT